MIAGVELTRAPRGWFRRKSINPIGSVVRRYGCRAAAFDASTERTVPSGRTV